MVVISASCGTLLMRVVQERITLPFMITEHDPHWPWPQATLVPVRPSWPRKTSASDAFSSMMTVLGCPLTFRSLFCITFPLLPPDWDRVHVGDAGGAGATLRTESDRVSPPATVKAKPPSG